MDVTVGVGPDTWGIWFPEDDRQPPWARYLDEAAEAGYEWIELGPFGYLPSDAAVAKAELARRGLRAASAFVAGDLAEPGKSWSAIERQLHGQGRLLSELGAKFLLLVDDNYTDLLTGKLVSPPQLDRAGFQRLIDTTRKVAEIARKEYGLQLLFHPGAETHVETEEQVEELLRRTEPELVSMVLDTGYHAYGGGDISAFLKRHADRIPYLHLKSFDSEIRAKVAAEKIPLAQAVAIGTFVELSRGVVDFAALRKTLEEIDFRGFAIFEQDVFPVPFDMPLPIARRTRQYLREIGIG